jgi:hypothetical protein
MTDGAPRNLDVPPTPLRGPRGGGGLGIAALAGLVGVIAGAVGLAQLAPPPADTPPPPIAEASPAVVVPPPPVAPPALAPDPGAVLARTTPRLSRPALESAVRDGSLDGRLVFVDGVLDVAPVRCQHLAQGSGGCVDLAIPGLGLPVWQGEDASPWRADPPPGAWLVTVARSGGLVYLGSLVPRPAGSLEAEDVAAASLREDVGTLFETDGYLVRARDRACAGEPPAASPCAGTPLLVDDEPPVRGIRVPDAGLAVSLASDAPGIDPDAGVVPGTFLVQPARTAGGGVRVIARYEPARSVRVLVP